MMPCLRRAGHTKRFHTHQTIGEQTVAEHSFHVAMLVIRIAGDYCNAEMIKAALYHDLPEIATGDIPAPVKWKNPDLNSILLSVEAKFECDNGLITILTDEEKCVLKLADSLELAQYVVDQLMLGNKNMKSVYEGIMFYIKNTSVWPDNPTTVERVQRVIEETEERYNAAIA